MRKAKLGGVVSEALRIVYTTSSRVQLNDFYRSINNQDALFYHKSFDGDFDGLSLPRG